MKSSRKPTPRPATRVECYIPEYLEQAAYGIAYDWLGRVRCIGGEMMNLREILADIHALEGDMLALERKYGIRSETFYAAYVSGEEPEDESWVLDFGEWASVYRTWLTRQAEYRNEVQRLQRDEPSLAGLIQVPL